jgi:hypothetical protein
MCTSFMSSFNTSGEPAVIFYGQFDPGESGSAGARDGRTVQLAEVLKEPTVRIERQDLKASYLREGPVYKARIEYALQETCASPNNKPIAEKLKESAVAKELFSGAFKQIVTVKLPGKESKEAKDDPHKDQKRRVLEYLATFLKTAGVGMS